MENGVNQNVTMKNLSWGFPFPYTVQCGTDFNFSIFLGFFKEYC